MPGPVLPQPDELSLVPGGEPVHTHAGQHAGRLATDNSLTQQRKDGRTHPQGLAGGQAPVIGESVQRYIDVRVFCKQLRMRRGIAKLNARGVDATLGETSKDGPAVISLAKGTALEHQP